MSSQSSKTKSSPQRGVAVQKQRASVYTMMMVASFAAISVASFCLYSLMNDYYKMQVKVPAGEKAPAAIQRQAPAAPGEAPAPGGAARAPRSWSAVA